METIIAEHGCDPLPRGIVMKIGASDYGRRIPGR